MTGDEAREKQNDDRIGNPGEMPDAGHWQVDRQRSSSPQGKQTCDEVKQEEAKGAQSASSRQVRLQKGLRETQVS